MKVLEFLEESECTKVELCSLFIWIRLALAAPSGEGRIQLAESVVERGENCILEKGEVFGFKGEVVSCESEWQGSGKGVNESR